LTTPRNLIGSKGSL